MAFTAFTVVDADVKLGSESTAADVSTLIGRAGEAITKGMVLRRGTDGKYYGADSSTADTASIKGVAATHAAIDGWIVIVTSGPLAIDNPAAGALTVESMYSLGDSTSSGDLGLAVNIVAGEYISYVGYAVSAYVLYVAINATGVTK